VDLLVDDDLAKDAERAIRRTGLAALETLRERFEQAKPPLRARILRAIGRLPNDGAVRELLLLALHDSDDKTRRNAAIALGRAPGDGVEDALLLAWDRETRVEMRRSIAASLGKVGSPRSLGLLREASRSEDAQLSRIADHAATMVERTASREHRGRLEPERAPGRPIDVDIFSRRGLEELLAEELAQVAGIGDARVTGPGRVRARLRGAMNALFTARTMLSFRFPLPIEKVAEGQPAAIAIARAATGDEARAILSTWTSGAIRYRIAWEGGGPQRALVWDTARAIARSAPELVNDPTASLWELFVARTPAAVEVAIAPRALDDPRFSWRRRDVPAASHPTIAAALARVAGARPDDVVWDPFVGSGAELVERALAGPYRSLAGSDIDERALAAARENLDAAGVDARLDRADALVHAPPAVTLVITNPPMGRRTRRIAGLANTLDRFVGHAASVLVPGGRLVWISPSPGNARAAGARAGLTLDWARPIDMGGFDAEMQRWTKR
jgi:23S rRNA G2445 N2-methylase RlmL